jgi:hypothetical protein
MADKSGFQPKSEATGFSRWSVHRILKHLGHTAESVDPAHPSRAPPQGDLLI